MYGSTHKKVRTGKGAPELVTNRRRFGAPWHHMHRGASCSAMGEGNRNSIDPARLGEDRERRLRCLDSESKCGAVTMTAPGMI